MTDFLLQWGPLIAGILSALVLITGLIIKMTPNQTDDGVWAVVKPFINMLVRLLGGVPAGDAPSNGDAPVLPPTLPGTEDSAGGLPMAAPPEADRPGPSPRDL